MVSSSFQLPMSHTIVKRQEQGVIIWCQDNKVWVVMPPLPCKSMVQLHNKDFNEWYNNFFHVNDNSDSF